jgi:NadR type nicotinamide-nucleotide adenylyltransferase
MMASRHFPKAPILSVVVLLVASLQKFNLKYKETVWLIKICEARAVTVICRQFWYLAPLIMQSVNLVSNTIKKVTVVGPECSGKTELSRFLASHFKTEWVPEYARAFLNKLNRPYEQADLLKIAHGQLRIEDEWSQNANKLLICDTNLIVIKVWSEAKFGVCDPEILKAMKSRHYDLLLLTNIDLPWEEDPLREHPDKREHFWSIYQKEAADSGIPTIEIRGPREQRRQLAVEATQKILN